jgi:hypothetical protein
LRKRTGALSITLKLVRIVLSLVGTLVEMLDVQKHMGQPYHTEFATNLTDKKLFLPPVWFYGRKVSGIPYFPLSFGLLA